VTSFWWAACWYCKYGISYRELQEMCWLNAGGMSITPMIYRWVQRYAPEMENGCAGTA
jgi:IS6 family transposase